MIEKWIELTFPQEAHRDLLRSQLKKGEDKGQLIPVALFKTMNDILKTDFGGGNAMLGYRDIIWKGPTIRDPKEYLRHLRSNLRGILLSLETRFEGRDIRGLKDIVEKYSKEIEGKISPEASESLQTQRFPKCPHADVRGRYLLARLIQTNSWPARNHQNADTPTDETSDSKEPGPVGKKGECFSGNIFEAKLHVLLSARTMPTSSDEDGINRCWLPTNAEHPTEP